MRPLAATLLISFALTGTAYSQESAPGDDWGGEDTSVAEPGDVGDPDSLSGVPETEIQTMPDFQDVSEEGATLPPQVESEDLTPPPSEMAPEVVEPPMERLADEPDLRRERNFHEIYRRHNVDPTPLEQWEAASSNRRSEMYQVQRGDTLWDLSSTLFGDSGYWPKIWALNKDQVYNPHEIDTWMQIRFFPGDMMDAPTLAVTETPPSLAATEEAPANDRSLIPPAKRSIPVVQTLPRSIPPYRAALRTDPVTNFDGLRPPNALPRPDAPLGYYISDRAINTVGDVEEVELGGKTAVEYQYVFVRVGNPNDRILTAVRRVGQVTFEGRKAEVIEVQGEIEVIDQAGNGLSRAIVRRNLAPIEVGAQLISGRIENVSTLDGEPSPGPTLRVVGAQYSSGRRMVDAEGLIFLSGGRNQGVQVGQIFGIYADRKLRNPTSAVTQNSDRIGHVRIVNVADNFATGFITRLTDEVLTGDLVGTSLSSTASAAPGVLDSSGPALDFDDFEEEAPMSAPVGDPGSGGSPSSGDDLNFDDEFNF